MRPIAPLRRAIGHSSVTSGLGITTLAAAAMVLAACGESERAVAPRVTPGQASFTAGSGSQSTLLGRATFAGSIDVKRKTGDWKMDIDSRGSTDVAVQSITFQPGSYSGWHQHPGPVLIQVVSGTMTFYESDDPTCTPIVRTAGQGYVDTGEHGHIARNETGSPAVNVVTYFAPQGAALRIDAPASPYCSF